jgi:hypothetical protein
MASAAPRRRTGHPQPEDHQQPGRRLGHRELVHDALGKQGVDVARRVDGVEIEIAGTAAEYRCRAAALAALGEVGESIGARIGPQRLLLRVNIVEIDSRAGELRERHRQPLDRGVERDRPRRRRRFDRRIAIGQRVGKLADVGQPGHNDRLRARAGQGA